MQDIFEKITLIIEALLGGLFAGFRKPKFVRRVLVVCILGLSVCLVHASIKSVGKLKIANISSEGLLTMSIGPMASTSAKKDLISIPVGVVKAHPFVPYRNIGEAIQTNELVMDVPQYDLIAPPDYLEESSENAKIMETAVSGILFDKFSPTAILKINGNDYLVKKGDTIQNYKIIAIAQDSVTVQSGKNTYTAGIGEFLTGGEVNYNEVSNLNKKFGGERR